MLVLALIKLLYIIMVISLAHLLTNLYDPECILYLQCLVECMAYSERLLHISWVKWPQQSNKKHVYMTKEVALLYTSLNPGPTTHNLCFRLWSFNQLWAYHTKSLPAHFLYLTRSSPNIIIPFWNSVILCIWTWLDL